MEIRGGALEPQGNGKEMKLKSLNKRLTVYDGAVPKEGKKLNENSSFAISPITHFILYLYYMSALKCINEHEFFTDGAIEHCTADRGQPHRSCIVKHHRGHVSIDDYVHIHIKGTIQKL